MKYVYWAACICSCVLIIGGIVCLILFLAVIPYQHMKFYVNDASLAEFYLTNDDMLHYNLAVNISVRNSNKIERIGYNSISSKAYCYGDSLTSYSLPSFRQGTKNTTLLYPVFQGQRMLKLRGSRLRDFIHDQRDGSYSIYLYLYIDTQLKHAGGGKGDKIGFVVNCGLLKLNLLGYSSSNNQTAGTGGTFKSKRCKVHTDKDYTEKILIILFICICVLLCGGGGS
ncbi:hypothetical protein MKW94_023098 [Papaver nudicaule]|uniref:Late embryogenesis abundant protein LEA-2 subgroup domain-containing protein n=1 Tax=Papaver nudicaule TaxID=74823 RepID=A0AA41VD32_PAPNU|nr:hypothetical protein [Papaver nudicaule]